MLLKERNQQRRLSVKFKLLVLSVVSYPLLNAASCGIKPCDFIQCKPGYHCENGACVQDPVEDPCQVITCDPFYKCVEGKCIASCDGYNCQAGFHCEVIDNKPICVRDPIVDPCSGVTCDPDYHCEKGNCVPNNPPTTNPCPKELAPNTVVYMNHKAYGQGWDSAVRVKGDPELCRLIHGESINDCHLEGWPKRAECEYYLLGNNCPVWEYMSNGIVYLCNDDHSAIASCDHFGNPINRDDPQTPTTGDTLENLRGFEGEPKVCGLHRDAFGPYQGYFTVAHGNGKLRACKPDRNPDTCSEWKGFNH